MTQRVALGNLGGSDYGLKVSKPGVDVLTGADAEMLFDSRRQNVRVIQSGSVPFFQSNSSPIRYRVNNVQVTIPPLAYEPLVFLLPTWRDSRDPDNLTKIRSSNTMGQLLVNFRQTARVAFDLPNNRMTLNSEVAGGNSAPFYLHFAPSDPVRVPTLHYLLFSLRSAIPW